MKERLQIIPNFAGQYYILTTKSAEMFFFFFFGLTSFPQEVPTSLSWGHTGDFHLSWLPAGYGAKSSNRQPFHLVHLYSWHEPSEYTQKIICSSSVCLKFSCVIFVRQVEDEVAIAEVQPAGPVCLIQFYSSATRWS